VYRDAIAPGRSLGPPINTLTDSASLLWRAELAGQPRDSGEWCRVRDYVLRTFPAPGVAFADVHSALAFAGAGDAAALDRLQQELEARARSGRLPAGPVVPALAAAFAAGVNGDWTAVVPRLAPHLDEHERIGGSRAQRDVVEYTLLRAYLETGRMAEAGALVRRAHSRGVRAPVAGADRLPCDTRPGTAPPGSARGMT